MSQEPEVADLHKAGRQDVEKKPLGKYLRGKRQEFLRIFVFSVFIRKYDCAVLNGNKPLVRNTDTVSVFPKILKNLLEALQPA